MLKLPCKLKPIWRILLAFFIVAFLILFLAMYQMRMNQTRQMIVRLTQQASRQLKPGISARNWSYEQYIAYGLGNCGQFAYILRKQLQAAGILAEPVMLHTMDSRVHVVLEVSYRGKKCVADPFSGVVYPYSMEQLLLHPALAEHYLGHLIPGRGQYFGNSFFKNVYYVNRALEMDNAGYALKKMTCKGECNLELSWPKKLDVKYIRVNSEGIFKVIRHQDPYQGKFFSDTTTSIPIKPGVSHVALDFFVAAKDKKNLKIETIATRESIGRIAKKHVKRYGYLSFSGAPIRVSEISLFKQGRMLQQLLLGNLANERKLSLFLYVISPENLGDSTLSGWSQHKLSRDGKPYRLANATPSKYGIAVIQLSPYRYWVEGAGNSEIQICYQASTLGRFSGNQSLKHKDSAIVSFYDVDKKQYQQIATLRPSNQSQCRRVQIPTALLEPLNHV